MTSAWVHSLLEWHNAHARVLPWRETQDPYAVWISEVMLQQTRVEAVIPYFLRWMESFPDIRSLAAADISDVLCHWEGLGYYRRAHNLHRAAQQLVSQKNGQLPADVQALQALPGIGSYTAAAIAAIAYHQDVIALDGNLRRVLSRHFNISEDMTRSAGQQKAYDLARQALPSGAASSFNQALMDLGALICLPKRPRCAACPLQESCETFRLGIQAERPMRKERKPLPHFLVTAGIMHWNGRVLLGRRAEGQLLGGLWEFPGGKCEPKESLEECLRREWQEELGVVVEPGECIGVYSHAYTHYRITLHAFELLWMRGEPRAKDHSELRWVKPGELHTYPMGKVDRAIAGQLLTRKSQEATSAGGKFAD